MRLSAKAPIVIRGEEITHLDADGYKHLPRATSLPDGKVLATSGGKWGASDLSGVSVASVFGRTGAVTAQTGDYTAAQVGAEPYAGTPAQTSFWRSTAAGVRAWVQLVAADITDLATTLAAYLTKLNPTYTGRLTGPTQYLEADEQIHLAIRRPGGQSGRIHGVAFQAQNDASAWVEFGRVTTYISSVAAGAHTGGMRLMAYKDGAILQALEAGPDGVRVGSGLPLQMGTTTVVDSSRNITGTTLKGDNLTGTGNRPLVAGADGTIDDQDAAMFRGTIGAGTSNLALGETSATAYPGNLGKSAYNHSQATGNPHGTTAADVGALAAIFPNFAGILYQDGTQRIAPNGTGWFQYLNSAALVGSTIRPLVVRADGFFVDQDAATFRGTIGAAKAPSKLEVSASTTLGAIDATAIKVTATDVNLTLSGGVDGQGWDIVCPTTSLGISIPTGVTLYAYNGSDTGPTTRAVGGGRGIRIVRIDAATWIAPNLTW